MNAYSIWVPIATYDFYADVTTALVAVAFAANTIQTDTCLDLLNCADGDCTVRMSDAPNHSDAQAVLDVFVAGADHTPAQTAAHKNWPTLGMISPVLCTQTGQKCSDAEPPCPAGCACYRGHRPQTDRHAAAWCPQGADAWKSHSPGDTFASREMIGTRLSWWRCCHCFFETCS